MSNADQAKISALHRRNSINYFYFSSGRRASICTTFDSSGIIHALDHSRICASNHSCICVLDHSGICALDHSCICVLDHSRTRALAITSDSSGFHILDVVVVLVLRILVF